MRIYSIYDSKSQLYSQPFYSMNNATAIRSFTLPCNEPGHDFNRFPADYTLMCIGEWDDRTGTVKASETNENLGLALHYVKADTTNGKA